nr:hypothetical protein [Tanacetum cinerariifolium]
MFAVCTCSRFQVTPKTSHLQVVKKIFRYLKGQPKLGLSYPKVSSFNLKAYSDSDYASSNLDRKSTTGGCQFFSRILISWQCKKQTIVATSATEAKYEEGIDYEKVVAPVARKEAIRLFLAYDSFIGFMVYEMDVKSAFLYGTIKEEVYVCQPLGFEDPDYPNKVYKVVKALYGLHQAPRAWYETLANYLLENGFQRGKIDQTFFIKKQKVKQKQDRIFISQDKYVAKNLRKFGLTDGKSANTPIDTKKPLLKDPNEEDMDVHTYKSMIDDAESIDCLPNEDIFAELERMSLVRNVDRSSKFYMYPRFLQLMIAAQVGDLSSHTTKYTSPTLTQKVFANMRRVGKGFSRVDTSLFEGMLVPQQVNDDDVAGDVADDKIAQALEITKLKQRVRRLEKKRNLKVSRLNRLKKVETAQKKSAQVYHIDLEHADKVLSMLDDEAETTKLKEVIEVVTTAKLMTEVVTAAVTTITASPITAAPSASRRRKGVVIKDPEETSTPSIIMHPESKSKDKGKCILFKEPKPLKKQAQIEQDEAYARKLEPELNANIN